MKRFVMVVLLLMALTAWYIEVNAGESCALHELPAASATSGDVPDGSGKP
jgi:hypothetical protein